MSARIKVDWTGADEKTKRKSNEMDNNDDSSEEESSCCNNLPSTSKASRVNPLIALRNGYLSVSDFVHQVWCEKQMVYSLTVPGVRENKLSRTGKSMHLARDLEVNSYVTLNCASREDNYAIHFMNLLSSLYEAQHQLSTSLREVPVFGIINGIYLMGRIDELRLDFDDFSIDLIEYKTRKHRDVPSDAQIIKHTVQLMLYKKMFDDIVLGEAHMEGFCKNLGLSLTRPFGEDVTHHLANNLGFLKEAPVQGEWNLKFLIDNILATAVFLPMISHCLIEFAWQRDGQTFHLQEIKYDLAWIERKLRPSLSYWYGERDAEGVDIEESWKCEFCEYSSRCKWLNGFKKPWKYR